MPKDVQAQRRETTLAFDLYYMLCNDKKVPELTLDLHKLLYSHDYKYFSTQSQDTKSEARKFTFAQFLEALKQKCSGIKEVRYRYFIQEYVPGHFCLNCKFSCSSVFCCNYSVLVDNWLEDRYQSSFFILTQINFDLSLLK